MSATGVLPPPQVPPSQFSRGTPWPKRSCMEQTAAAFGSGVAVGGFVGAVKAAWVNSPKHANLPMRITLGGVGELAVLFGAIGGVYAATSCALSGLRKTEDPINALFGGACAGATLGVYKQSLRFGAGAALLCAAGAGFSDLAGGLQRRSEKTYKKIYSVNEQTPYEM